MNGDRIQGNWKQVAGKAKEQWGKLNDDDLDLDLDLVAGRHERLAGKIQERYGLAREDVEQQLAAWQRTASDAWFGPVEEPR